MKRIVLPLLLGLALALSACAPGIQATRGGITDRGQLVFNAYTQPAVGCYRCHNGDARGTKWGPDLVEIVPDLTDEDIQTIVLEGEGGMPSFRGKLGDGDMEAIIAWLRSAAAAAEEPAPTTGTDGS